MRKLILTLLYQNDFLSALKNYDIKRWSQHYEDDLSEISDAIKSVDFSNCDLKQRELLRFICSNFLVLLKALWNPNEWNLKRKSIFQAFISENRIEKFKRRLLNSNKRQNWKKFNSKYKFYFDSIIRFARNQRLLDVRVVGKDNVEYLSFDEAENCQLINEKHSRNVQKTKISKFNTRQTEPTRYEFNRETNLKRTNVPSRLPDIIENSDSSDTISNRKQLKGNKFSTHRTYEQQINDIRNSPPRKPILTNNHSEIPKNQQKIYRTPSEVSNSPTLSFVRNAMDSSFQRKLNAQNKKFAEEMESIREKRERLNREAEEEMSKFRRESAMRIRMFLNCIQLKLRWEEQENEWSDWLKCAREPVIKVKTQFLDFDRIRRFDDENEIMAEVMCIHKYVQIAYDKLLYDFENLTLLTERYEDKTFLKFIQKSVSKMATRLCILMEHLEEFRNSREFYSKLNKLESEIDSMDIPTTSKLRLIYESTPDDYHKCIITPPQQRRSHCVVTEI